jgi:hypothetical protein
MDSDEEEAEAADQFLNLAIQTKSLKLFTSVQTVWTDFRTYIDRIAYIVLTNHIIIEPVSLRILINSPGLTFTLSLIREIVAEIDDGSIVNVIN